MSDDKRPVWGFSEMSEADFRKVHEFGVVRRVESKSRMTSEDASEQWLEAYRADAKCIVMPRNWACAFEFTGNWYNPGMFKLTYLGERMAAAADAIDKWERKNKADRAAYERMKAKFEAPGDAKM